ncbi:hypothetical protein [Streptococcus hyovaginalis]|uniref:hypothetical protein n=1 Tax=Streptococcus hyovaginalis TaxID=149015 RepID=UPI001BB10CD4|nr:hypothetical protein [Streptococcus hyovaginalis]
MNAILEGLNHRIVEERENLSGLALELRYTLNAKTVKESKLSKKKQHDKIVQLFNPQSKQGNNFDQSELLKRIEKLNNHFRNKK